MQNSTQESTGLLISVVMATYNGQDFLQQQLESIVNQTYSPIEIVITDDGSLDTTKLMLKQAAARDSRIKLLLHPQNLGLTQNFERGFRAATGDWIAPCDQDDLWHPEKLSRMVGQLNGQELVFHDSALIDAQGNSLHRKLSDKRQMAGFSDPLNYAIGGSAPGHAMLLKKELLHRCYPFPADIPFDYWIGFVATLQQPILYIDEVLVQYRMHDSNAFGVKVKGASTKRRSHKNDSSDKLRRKMDTLASRCPEDHPRKPVFEALRSSYQSFSLANNFRRMALFFRYRHAILHYKKKPAWRKWVFCLKTFITLQ